MGNTHMAEIARFEADMYVSKWQSPDDFKWGYGRDRGTHVGPDNWWVYFPAAGGDSQSPIDITPEEAIVETDYKLFPIAMKYHRLETRVLQNTGTGWTVTVNDSKSAVSGGPLQHKYTLHHFTMHWGEKDDVGSEHMIHHKPYSGELHFVHWNKEKYGSFEEASDGDDGICILAVFVKVDVAGSTNGLKTIGEHIENIRAKGSALQLEAGFDIASMFPDDIGKYWTYKGSLTTPPCTENVLWVIFFDYITISSEELAAFRTLQNSREGDGKSADEFDGKILKNYRPMQSRGARHIRTSETQFNQCNDFQNQYMSSSLFQSNPKDYVSQFG